MTDKPPYNYDTFSEEAYAPWHNFETSPPLGEFAPDLTLTTLEGDEVSLSEIWRNNAYTIIEFGSFT